MINKELLTTIKDTIGGQIDYDELAASLDLLEKANAGIYGLLLTARMKKIMKVSSEPHAQGLSNANGIDVVEYNT